MELGKGTWETEVVGGIELVSSVNIMNLSSISDPFTFIIEVRPTSLVPAIE